MGFRIGIGFGPPPVVSFGGVFGGGHFGHRHGPEVGVFVDPAALAYEAAILHNQARAYPQPQPGYPQPQGGYPQSQPNPQNGQPYPQNSQPQEPYVDNTPQRPVTWQNAPQPPAQPNPAPLTSEPVQPNGDVRTYPDVAVQRPPVTATPLPDAPPPDKQQPAAPAAKTDGLRLDSLTLQEKTALAQVLLTEVKDMKVTGGSKYLVTKSVDVHHHGIDGKEGRFNGGDTGAALMQYERSVGASVNAEVTDDVLNRLLQSYQQAKGIQPSGDINKKSFDTIDNTTLKAVLQDKDALKGKMSVDDSLFRAEEQAVKQNQTTSNVDGLPKKVAELSEKFPSKGTGDDGATSKSASIDNIVKPLPSPDNTPATTRSVV